MTASSQIIFALRAASPKYTPMIQPTFGWLLRLAIQQSHQNPRPHRPLNFFFCRSIRHPKRWANVLPHAFRPCSLPLQCPLHRRHHRSVGCCISPPRGSHLRQVLRPSLIFPWAPFRRPKQGDQMQRARARPPAASIRLIMGSRGAAIRVHGVCCHGD